MDVLTEPFPERPELPTLELPIEIGQVFHRSFPELHGDHVPERVGREVAETRVGPMHVLQDSVDDTLRLDSEVFTELRVERLRQVRREDVSREHLPLELEAQNDMERVGHLVCVHAAHARLDPVERAVKGL